MTEKGKTSRRKILGHALRGATLLSLGGATTYLTLKARKIYSWHIEIEKCVNSRLGAVGVEVCESCADECVLALSAIKAVNDHSKCGRCYICPAYFSITSAVDEEGLPSEKLCPRDAIKRIPIGEIDPYDPANNYYDYIIDEVRCTGCGRCVMGCKEPAGLGSIILEVRHDTCLDCNRCSISIACPDEAYVQQPAESS